MRATCTEKGLTVNLIAGTHVVLIAMNLTKARATGLLGFSIERTDHTEGEKYFLKNFLLFKVNDTGAKADHSSDNNPFQEFLWGDYTAKPEHTYTYRVIAKKGRPGRLQPDNEVSVTVTTESEVTDDHAIFFNRGVAASQAYADKFHNQRPEKVPNNAAYIWLSRGLEEALLKFIGQASGPGFGLRACMYEFSYPEVLQAFGIASRAGADVRIVYDYNAKTVKDKSTGQSRTERDPGDRDLKAITTAGITALCTPRQQSDNISHNKFIVLLEGNRPVQVWTGSTNITEGGIFGHSNCGQIVRDPAIARVYLDYWKRISGDPGPKAFKAYVESLTPVPDKKGQKPPKQTMLPVLSPRPSIRALKWYAELMDGAKSGVFATFPFGVNADFLKVLAKRRAFLRYALLDKPSLGRGPNQVEIISRDPNNRATAGTTLKGGLAQWAAEKLTGLNVNVPYIHTKYMIIDPLGDDPIVINGSANFSENSILHNDENSLVARGDMRMADVFLGEFMRLFNHYYFRAAVTEPRKPNDTADSTHQAAANDPAGKVYLKETDGWAMRFFEASNPRARERKYFGGTIAI
ncbi:MAG TPA: phospholipase D-like domain-containing protein [Vicinamibacterales bacterium]|jgi:phosphatidylserine/phosphatidylglycerophosphate/cardiolipin synthase-like enzyme